ncbi:hypothetical protein N8492_02440 [Synechococcus sp. AH-601-O06]|nr:hypothetical protein [Synechococcus sp. AH-601-O06]
MKIYDDDAFLSRFDESAQILEDWINRTTSEDHAQLNKLYSDMNKKVQKKYLIQSLMDDKTLYCLLGIALTLRLSRGLDL